MKKVLVFYGILVIAIVIFALSRGFNLINFSLPGGSNTQVLGATTKAGEKTYKLIVAKTDEEKIKGLSGRDSLPKDTGMLFVFEEKGNHGFWMKNMKFPLDIVYISDNKVVEIIENAPAPSENQDPSTLPIYKPSEPANYVLELNAGQAKESNIKQGDTIELNDL